MRRDEQGERDLRKGLRELSAHRPDRALRLFRSSVESCSATHPAELEKRLYWLAMALLQLDQVELALKSLASAQKLRPRGMARRAYLLRANDYGMPRRASPDLDDFYAFYSVQVCGFLARKQGRRFSSEEEKDAVTRLVAFAWQGLKKGGSLAGLGPGEKLDLFRGQRNVFPDFVVDGRRQVGSTGGSFTITVDFRRSRTVKPNDSCSCGSGLPYRLCCGRLDSSSCRG